MLTLPNVDACFNSHIILAHHVFCRNIGTCAKVLCWLSLVHQHDKVLFSINFFVITIADPFSTLQLCLFIMHHSFLLFSNFFCQRIFDSFTCPCIFIYLFIFLWRCEYLVFTLILKVFKLLSSKKPGDRYVYFSTWQTVMRRKQQKMISCGVNEQQQFHAIQIYQNVARKEKYFAFCMN